MKRKLAEHDNLKITIEQNGDKFHVKESSTFRTKEVDFTLGVQFDYSLADGTEVAVSSGNRSEQRSNPCNLLISVIKKTWPASISGSLGDGGRDDEGKIHPEGQQQGPDHHQDPGGRRDGAGRCSRDHRSIISHKLVCF